MQPGAALTELNEDGAFVKAVDIEAMAKWDVKCGREQEIAFRTARVLLQDFTGVPAVVDLAAMRDAIIALGGNPDKVNPLQPVELVIDHSVQVDHYTEFYKPDGSYTIQVDSNDGSRITLIHDAASRITSGSAPGARMKSYSSCRSCP